MRATSSSDWERVNLYIATTRSVSSKAIAPLGLMLKKVLKAPTGFNGLD